MVKRQIANEKREGNTRVRFDLLTLFLKTKSVKATGVPKHCHWATEFANKENHRNGNCRSEF